MSQISNFLVKKSNDLMVARYSMTVNEQRLLLACISQIPMDTLITSEFEFVLTIEQAQELFYTESGKHNIYRDMKDAVSALWHREVKIRQENGDVLQTRFVSSIIWVADQNTIKVNFAPKILPYLSILKGNFTRYRLNNVVQLTSFYAVRIYELLLTWSKNGNENQKEIEIDELKQILDIEEKYNQFGQFREKVIEIAIAQINANTDFTVSVEFKKYKRAFRWIKFNFNQKPEIAAIEKQRQTEKRIIANHNKSAKKQREYAEQKIAERQRIIDEQQARKLAEEEQQRKKQEIRKQKAIQTIEMWLNFNENEQMEVQKIAVQSIIEPLRNSLTEAFEINNYNELTGRFLENFSMAVKTVQNIKINEQTPQKYELINSEQLQNVMQSGLLDFETIKRIIENELSKIISDDKYWVSK